MKQKSLVNNSILFSLFKILNVLFPFIISAYVSHILMPSGIGQVASAQNIAAYFIFGAALGIPVYGTRVIARSKDSHEDLDRSFSELFLLNLFSSCVFTLAYVILLTSNNIVASETKLLFICGLPIALNIISIDWLYQGLEKYGYILTRSLICKVIALIATFLLVKNENDVFVYAAILIFASSANSFLNIIRIKHVVNFKFRGISLKKHIRPIMIFFFSSLAIELYTMVDVTMLTYLRSDSVVGLYSNATKTVKSVIMLLTALSAVTFPRFSIDFEHNEGNNIRDLSNKTMSVLFFLALPSMIGMIFLAEEIIKLFYSDAFILAVPTMQILSMLIVPITFSTFWGSHLLCAVNKEKKMLYAVLAGAGTNICLNSILIPLYAQNGAAVASVVSEIVVFIVDYIMVRKYVRLGFCTKDMVLSIIASAIMALFVLLIKLVIRETFVCLLIAVLGGIFVYACASYFLKNPIFFTLIDKLKLFLKSVLKVRKKS
jgi:O-antigen/teichoic acid export membrane protein